MATAHGHTAALQQIVIGCQRILAKDQNDHSAEYQASDDREKCNLKISLLILVHFFTPIMYSPTSAVVNSDAEAILFS